MPGPRAASVAQQLICCHPGRPLKYDSIYKYGDYIISLFSASTGIKNAIDIQDINTKKKRALTLKSPALEIQIYDKALESNNRQLYTRVEIRFKNIRDADIYSLAERLHTLIDSLSAVIKKVEKQKIGTRFFFFF